MCHGVFDLFHIGHLNHINEAKKLGDILIVSVTTDKYVNKGPGRPFFNQATIKFVIFDKNIDYVVQSDSPSGVELINKIKPNIYFKGPDYLNHSDDFTGFRKVNAVKKHNGKIVYSTGETYSSSKILNKIQISMKIKKIIKEIKKTFL